MCKIHDSVDTTEASYNLDDPRFKSTHGQGTSVFPKIFRPTLGCIQHCIQWVQTFSQGKSRRGVKFSTHLHLVPRLRMSGSLPLFSLHAFMAWTRTTLLFYV